MHVIIIRARVRMLNVHVHVQLSEMGVVDKYLGNVTLLALAIAASDRTSHGILQSDTAGTARLRIRPVHVQLIHRPGSHSLNGPRQQEPLPVQRVPVVCRLMVVTTKRRTEI